jgi:predicted RNA binding protein YcfA (HicA-like mRNA interferase family)
MKPKDVKEVIKLLEGIGFKKVRQKGSHLFLKHSDGRTTVIPIHSGEKIGPGLLSKIRKDAKLSKDEFESLFNK